MTNFIVLPNQAEELPEDYDVDSDVDEVDEDEEDDENSSDEDDSDET